MSNQLIKTTEQGKENVFPRTRIQDLFDDTSGQKLIDILKSFNMMFVPYLGNKSQTRNQISPELRRQGLWLTYVIDNTVYTEWYDEVAIDDTNWGSDSNWRQGSNALVGDLSISPNGTWVINGEDSGITIKGDKGDSPVIRIYDNKIQVSYDKGVTYENLNNTPVYTKFRFNSQTNTYQVSYDLGANWQDISDEKVYHKFRYNSTTNTYQESVDFYVTQTASSVMSFEFVEILVVGQKLGKMLVGCKCVKIREHGVPFHLAFILDTKVIGVGKHRHNFRLYLVGRVRKVNAVAERFAHLCFSVDTGKSATLLVAWQKDFGFDKSFAVNRVEFAHDFFALLQHRFLVFADGNGRRLERRDVRGLADRISQESYGNTLFKVAHFYLGFYGRIALQSRKRDEIHIVKRKFRKFRHGRLNENR